MSDLIHSLRPSPVSEVAKRRPEWDTGAWKIYAHLLTEDMHRAARALEAKDAEIERLRAMIEVDADLLLEKETIIDKLKAPAHYYVEQCGMCATGVECQDSLCWAFREAAALNTGEHHCAQHGWYADRPCIHCAALNTGEKG